MEMKTLTKRPATPGSTGWHDRGDAERRPAGIDRPAPERRAGPVAGLAKPLPSSPGDLGDRSPAAPSERLPKARDLTGGHAAVPVDPLTGAACGGPGGAVTGRKLGRLPDVIEIEYGVCEPHTVFPAGQRIRRWRAEVRIGDRTRGDQGRGEGKGEAGDPVAAFRRALDLALADLRRRRADPASVIRSSGGGESK